MLSAGRLVLTVLFRQFNCHYSFTYSRNVTSAHLTTITGTNTNITYKKNYKSKIGKNSLLTLNLFTFLNERKIKRKKIIYKLRQQKK